MSNAKHILRLVTAAVMTFFEKLAVHDVANLGQINSGKVRKARPAGNVP